MTLLTQDYFLADEYTTTKNISMANVSMTMKNLFKNDDISDDFLKLGNCTFINKKFNKLPRCFKDWLSMTETTDFSEYLPSAFLESELGLSKKEIIQSGIVLDETIIFKKRFYRLNTEFFKEHKKHILYTLDKFDFQASQENIKGYLRIGRKYLTWY